MRIVTAFALAIALLIALPLAMPPAAAIVGTPGTPVSCGARTSDSVVVIEGDDYWIRVASASVDTTALVPGNYRVDWRASVTWFRDGIPLWTPPVGTSVSHDEGFRLTLGAVSDRVSPYFEGLHNGYLFALPENTPDNIVAHASFEGDLVNTQTGLGQPIESCNVLFGPP